MGKIKKSLLPEPFGKIHKRYNLPEDHIRFSFKYLDSEHDKFHLKNVDNKYLEILLDRLKAISSMKINEFRMAGNKSLRSHSIDWNETTEPQGFTHLKNEQLRQCEPWQFELTSNKHGRVHGILLDEIFYVVWFDPKHELYSRK